MRQLGLQRDSALRRGNRRCIQPPHLVCIAGGIGDGRQHRGPQCVGGGVARVAGNRRVKMAEGFAVAFQPGGQIIQRMAAQEGFVGRDVFGPADGLLDSDAALGFIAGGDLGDQRKGNGFSDFGLNREDIFQPAIIAVGPADQPAVDGHQLCRNAHPGGVALHAAAQDVADAELAPDGKVILSGDHAGRGGRGHPKPRIAREG